MGNGDAAEESGDMDQRSADQNPQSDVAAALEDGREVAVAQRPPPTAEEDSGRVGGQEEAIAGVV